MRSRMAMTMRALMQHQVGFSTKTTPAVGPSRPLTTFLGAKLVPRGIRHGAAATAFQRQAYRAAAFRPSAIVAAAATDAPTDAQEETFTYQAEVDRLMDMIVHSLYSNRDVFLRELVSNASDALDKERFLALTKNKSEAGSAGGSELQIRVRGDAEAKTITIEDNGVGMTREELMSSLGTIARSGTAKFMEAMKEAAGDANLIGQFGVGFYSAFLVADRVRVETKSDDDTQAWVWESSAGSHQYVVREAKEGTPQRGTRLTLFLKEDAAEYADDKKLQGLIKQYSEFISFPIYLYTSKQQSREVEDEEATKQAQEEADAKAKEEGKEGAEPVQPVMKTEFETVFDYSVQNDTKPLWLRSPKEVTKDEYEAFFKATFREFLEPCAYSHFNVEGTIEFTGLLYVPGMAPFEQQDPVSGGGSRNMRLYVKRVFISDEFDQDLMPRYLAFIKGIVDSSDLPLNVSREILQESRVVKVMRKQLVKRSLDMLQDLSKSEDPKAYATFWEAFGRNLKLGCIEDQANKGALAGLLRFPSSQSGDDLTSLSEYVSRMKEGQGDSIFYMAADSREAAQQAPFVESLIAKGYEVLYLTEPIDEVCVTNIAEFEGKKLMDVTREDLNVEGEEDKKKVEEAAATLKGLTEFMKGVLGDKVERVDVSSRLQDSPCALVVSKFGWSANMERIMKSQAMGDARAMEYMRGRRIMEINPGHPTMQSLKRLVDEGAAQRDSATSMVQLLYETSLLTSGFAVDSPKDFAGRIYDMIGAAASAGQGSNDSGSSGGNNDSEVVTAEVVADDGGDPWARK